MHTTLELIGGVTLPLRNVWAKNATSYNGSVHIYSALAMETRTR